MTAASSHHELTINSALNWRRSRVWRDPRLLCYVNLGAISETMMTKRSILLFTCFMLAGRLALSCDLKMTTSIASPEEIRAFFRSKKKKVLTFLGYSGAGYENKTVMLEEATRALDKFDPQTTIINIGATAEGIGAVYEIAKRKGFLTTGIVSTQAKENKIVLSPCVDVVFYVNDPTWGGFIPGTKTLSPTSTAIVENSTMMIAIGGGEVARDELIAAKRLGKQVQFIPADMNHQVARDKALKKGKSAPSEFRGPAGSTALE